MLCNSISHNLHCPFVLAIVLYHSSYYHIVIGLLDGTNTSNFQYSRRPSVVMCYRWRSIVCYCRPSTLEQSTCRCSICFITHTIMLLHNILQLLPENHPTRQIVCWWVAFAITQFTIFCICDRNGCIYCCIFPCLFIKDSNSGFTLNL